MPKPDCLPAAALVLATLCGACASGRATPGLIVDDIEFKGVDALSPREIKRKILTAETPWYPFAKKSIFEPADWEMDLRRIERLYETHGYYRARVARAQVVPDGEHEVDLVVEIEENQPVKTQALALTGLQKLPSQEKLEVEADLPVAPGEVFREDDFTAAKGLVRARLRNTGYATAAVDGHAVVDTGTQGVNVDIEALPGPRYHFGPIEVRHPGGKVNRAWIEDEVRLALGRDKPYSDDALIEAQRRVFAMNVFSTARVTTGAPDVARQQIPVIAEVREAPMHTLRLGGGAGIDQVRQELRLITEWTDRNFLGGLRRLTLRGLGGWAFLPSTYAVLRASDAGPRHGPMYRASADLEQPRLFHRTSLKGKALLESERTVEEAYDAIGGRSMVGVIIRPHSTITLFPSYNFHTSWLDARDFQSFDPNVNTARAAPLALGCAVDPCLVLLSFLEQSLSWDSRDSALEPRRGHYLSLSLQEGGGPLRGDFDYLRIMPDLRTYASFGDDDRFTFAARLRVGTLLTRGSRPEESPIVTRFYTGGALGMRGFAMRRLSPLLLVDVGSDPTAKLALPIGGNGIIEGSFEMRARFTERVVVATFADFGQVTRARLPVAKLPSLLWALGFGIRYLTPVGPIRVDLAFRLPTGTPPPLFNLDGNEISYERGPAGTTKLLADGDDNNRHLNTSCFGIGGNANTWVRDGLCAFHISIGEAF